jgi:hypothetical protein
LQCQARRNATAPSLRYSKTEDCDARHSAQVELPIICAPRLTARRQQHQARTATGRPIPLPAKKKEALDNAEKAVAELNELGFHYSLLEGASTASTARAPRKAASQAPKRQVRDVPCPICGFKTTHHDGRMHRSQKTKKPFTIEELMERGLTKVG